MFKTAAAKIAHNSTIPALGGNSDLRPLQDLILAEKQVLISLQKLSLDFSKAAEALRVWGSGEGEDLDDILGASATLLTLWSTALSQYASHGHPMRDYLKSIRTREEMLDDLKRRRKTVSAKADSAERKLSKMSPEHKNMTTQTDALNALRVEIRTMDSEIMTEEAAIGDFKRSTTRAWMGLKFGGLLECAEKGTIAGEFGKLIVSEVSEEQTQPGMARSLYYGRTKTEQLLSEAHRCINDVVMSTVPAENTSGQQGMFHQPQQNYPQHTLQASIQGTPQNPFGTPQPYFQGMGMPNTNVQPSQRNSNETAPAGVPDYSFMSHQYLGQPGSAMTGPGSPTHEHYPPPASQVPGYSQPDYPEQMPLQTVDDFGLNTRTLGLIDQPEPGTGGRFATFPVKTRAGGSSGYTLSDPRRQDNNDSFSSSVAQALSSSQSPPVTTTQANFSNDPSSSHNAVHAPQALPSGAAQPENWNANTQHEASDDEGGLPYMANPDGHRDSRHVRFGEVSDVDDELEKRGRRSNSDAPGYEQPWPQHQLQEQQPLSKDPPQYQDLPPTVEPVGQSLEPSHYDNQNGGASGNTPQIADARFQKQRRVPPPSMDLDNERALDAAAAREVSRELEALNLGPSHTPNKEVPDWNQATPTQAGDNSLAPPTTPFSGRLPSPHPGVDSPILPYAPHNTPLTTYSQPNSQASYPQEAILSQQQAPSVLEAPGPNSSGVPRLGGSGTAAKIELPRLPPLTTQRPSSPYGTPYQTPPEYPRGLGMSSSPVIKSNTSLPSQIPPGTKTISAAAFKRPQRVASGDIHASLPDGRSTSPLSIRKRLPSSPHPQREGSPQRRGRSGSPAQPPTPAPSQALPPIPTEDEDYDYLSAYVDAGVPAGAAGPQKVANEAQPGTRPQGGYGEGRFATDLEGGLR